MLKVGSTCDIYMYLEFVLTETSQVRNQGILEIFCLIPLAWQCPLPHQRVGASSAPVWALNPSLLSPDFPGSLLLFLGASDNAQDRVRIPVGPGSHSTTILGELCPHHRDEALGHGPRAHPCCPLCSPSLDTVYVRMGYSAPRVDRKVSCAPNLTVLPAGQAQRKQRSLWEGSANLFCKGTVSKYFSFVRMVSEGTTQLWHCSVNTATGNR